MIRLLSILVLVLSIALAPPAVLALISNNAVPGDRAYPIKRFLENVIVTGASVNPTTKAWFSQTRSNRRYKEVEILLSQHSTIANKSLGELASQTNTAVNDISVLSDTSSKKQLVKNLITNIDTYNKGISDSVNTTNKASTSTPESTPTPTPTPSPTPVPSVDSGNTERTTTRSTPTSSPSQSPRVQVDKCESGEPLSREETTECNNKAKYRACALIGLDRTQCDNLARQTDASVSGNTSPSPSPSHAAEALADTGASGGGGATRPQASPVETVRTTGLAVDRARSLVTSPSPSSSPHSSPSTSSTTTGTRSDSFTLAGATGTEPLKASLNGPNTATVNQTISYSSGEVDSVDILANGSAGGIYVAKDTSSGPARVTAEDISGFDIARFNCDNSDSPNCSWYNITSRQGPTYFSAYMIPLKAGTYKVITTMTPEANTAAASDNSGKLRSCSNNPYVTYPFPSETGDVGGYRFHDCGSPAITLTVQ